MSEDKHERHKHMGEALRLQNHKRQAAQQEASDTLNQRVQQAYQGWSEVPEGLCTKAQLKREGLRLPEGVEPVAEVYVYGPGQRRHPFYDLYRREDAVARDPQAPIDPYNYEELAQLWHEFLHYGPPIDQATFHPIDFCEWLNSDDDTSYGLPDVVRFLDEKEHRDLTTLKSPEQGETNMAEISQEQLLGYIDSAITFYERVTGHLPTTKQVQALLAVAGIHEPFEYIEINGGIVLSLRNKEESDPEDEEESGPELRQCPYCFELQTVEHIELCLLNPKRI